MFIRISDIDIDITLNLIRSTHNLLIVNIFEWVQPHFWYKRWQYLSRENSSVHGIKRIGTSV